MAAPKVHSLSDMLPPESAVEGEFGMEGRVSLRQQASEADGELYRLHYDLECDFGEAEFVVFGGAHYLTEWGRYNFKRGLTASARTEQPFIELHVQLEGNAETVGYPLGLDFTIQAGETNMVFLPSLDASFELGAGMEGAVFEVAFSLDYFKSLGLRYPHLFEGFLEKLHREEPYWLNDRHLRLTPQMRGVIQRIRQQRIGSGAGALFLEAQILELVALQFAELDKPVLEKGQEISPPDWEYLHAARDLLLARIADPPSLTELALAVGTNEYKLKRGFKQVFGTSPYAYLLQHRLELARSYVLDSGLTIAEIAYRVGYSDPAHLTHAFRKQYGIRPSDLR